ncbi:hypothetical protein LLS47_20240 [Rouxiella badensis]|uniref:hypothetical protein n=1 Tax=Rouxiella badensis TaxID=1646377 RepID=UPI0013EEF13A|nr:hypothetical protein [Rouxiella badensis]MCC3721347.1 hypothetical protein [Rouxiella badensis]MCC3731136.1 hypothetical protein [Rouxiella badensis]MCC3735267.1 hypothetical protein [Rouxiella badensis]MCC3760564.1 hypothetical protein [Rouxiella badensis]QII38204.1 hypothetical protein G3M83_11100 [Rouxiella badensis]
MSTQQVVKREKNGETGFCGRGSLMISAALEPAVRLTHLIAACEGIYLPRKVIEDEIFIFH